MAADKQGVVLTNDSADNVRVSIQGAGHQHDEAE
jgi:hypothetical protein